MIALGESSSHIFYLVGQYSIQSMYHILGSWEFFHLILGLRKLRLTKVMPNPRACQWQIWDQLADFYSVVWMGVWKRICSMSVQDDSYQQANSGDTGLQRTAHRPIVTKWQTHRHLVTRNPQGCGCISWIFTALSQWKPLLLVHSQGARTNLPG